MIYVGKIGTKPNGYRGPRVGYDYRIISYSTCFDSIRNKLIAHRKTGKKPIDVFGKELKWGPIRIECWEEDCTIGHPYETKEVLIIK